MSIRLRMFLQSFSGDGAGSDIVHDVEYSARNFSSSPLTISGLEGNTFDYEFIIVTSNVSGDSLLDMTFNADTTANYRNHEIKGLSSTASAAVSDSDTAIELQNFFGTANPNMLKMQILGSSGDERYISASYSADGAILEQSSYWKNTASELTSVTITAASSVTSDAHVVLIRYPKVDVQGSWEYVSSLTWSAETATKNFTVDGDADKKYKIVCKFSSGEMQVRLNSDSTSNYPYSTIFNNFGSLSISTSTTSLIRGFTAWNDATYIINADSGADRLLSVNYSRESTNHQQTPSTNWWGNSVDNLTAINCNVLSANITGTADLYKVVDVDKTADTITFQEIETVDIAGIDFSAGHTFSSLTGNSSTLYKVEWLGDTAANLRMQINADTGSNYIDQYIQGSFSVTAATATTAYFVMKSGADASEESWFEFYLHPKSGNNRPGLNYQSNDEDTVRFGAKTWLNSVDQITSIKVFASTTATTTGTLRLSRMI